MLEKKLEEITSEIIDVIVDNITIRQDVCDDNYYHTLPEDIKETVQLLLEEKLCDMLHFACYEDMEDFYYGKKN